MASASSDPMEQYHAALLASALVTSPRFQFHPEGRSCIASATQSKDKFNFLPSKRAPHLSNQRPPRAAKISKHIIFQGCAPAITSPPPGCKQFPITTKGYLEMM